MLSRISTDMASRKPKSKKRKIILVVAAIFVGIVFYGIYNLSKIKTESGEKVSVDISTGDQPVSKSIKITISADGSTLNLRKEASSDSEKISDIPDKTELTVEEELDGWYKVTYESKQGWIAKK
jgi:uncharacterized protein YgiM (DUF1202 family)